MRVLIAAAITSFLLLTLTACGEGALDPANAPHTSNVDSTAYEVIVPPEGFSDPSYSTEEFIVDFREIPSDAQLDSLLDEFDLLLWERSATTPQTFVLKLDREAHDTPVTAAAVCRMIGERYPSLVSSVWPNAYPLSPPDDGVEVHNPIRAILPEHLDTLNPIYYTISVHENSDPDTIHLAVVPGQNWLVYAAYREAWYGLIDEVVLETATGADPLVALAQDRGWLVRWVFDQPPEIGSGKAVVIALAGNAASDTVVDPDFPYAEEFAVLAARDSLFESWHATSEADVPDLD